MNTDIRWKQRFESFDKAFAQLSDAVSRKEYDNLAIAGLIQTFQFTFELAWKTLKDKLEYEGFTANSPRETIKTAFQNGFIVDGHTWIDALEKRNVLTHTYDQAKSNEAKALICETYYPLLLGLHTSLKKSLS